MGERILICSNISKIPSEFATSGVYAIQHVLSNKMYVGSSVRVRARLWQHIRMLRTNCHHSSHLQRAWNKYGEKAFIVAILQKVSDKNELVKVEQKWMNRLRAFGDGYNARPKAESMHGVKWSEDQNNRRRTNNILAWANPKLRKELSLRFKGIHRGIWTDVSKNKSSQSLKAFHIEHPEERWKFRDRVWKDPVARLCRVKGVRRSLTNIKIYKARVDQLRQASQSPKRIRNLGISYHLKKGYPSLGYKTPDQLTQRMFLQYNHGDSLRQIGHQFNLDHKSVAQRLRKLGIKIEQRYRKGNLHPFAKLTEQDIKKIRKYLRKGETQQKIADRFGVSNSIISDISTNKSWKHV